MSELKPKMLDGKIENFTLKAAGKPFYCQCGCNVFHKPDETNDSWYRCNSCNANYRLKK